VIGFNQEEVATFVAVVGVLSVIAQVFTCSFHLIAFHLI